jgi:hypothetical protein
MMRVRSVLAALVILIGPSTALAYSIGLTEGTTGNIVKWTTTSPHFYLHPDCSTDLNTTACLNEARAAFSAWQNVSCSNLSFVDNGFSNNKALTAVNGGQNDKNEVAWIENGVWQFGTYTLGVTAPWFSSTGKVLEADIAMNGYLQTWSINGQDYSTDVRNVLVHEIGHFFGLQHVLGGFSQNDPPSMGPKADPFMQSQTPNADDQAGICFLYPAGAWSCSSDNDCPKINADGPQGEYYAGVLSCQGGKCGGFSNNVPKGTAVIGETCAADYDCVDPYFCQPVQGGYGVCASECKPSNPNCPSGYDCVAFSNVPDKGVCLEKQGGPSGGQKNIGEPCTYSTDCKSLLCVGESGGSVCRQICYNASECPAGEACMPLQGVNYGACYPDSGTNPNTGKEVGETCVGGSECKSGLCAGSNNIYLCTKPCINTSQCPENYECVDLTGGGGGCFPKQGSTTPPGSGKELGEPCEFSSDCKSGQCITLSGSAPFCTAECTSPFDCPCGMQCVQIQGGGGVCSNSTPQACLKEGEACGGDGECVSGFCKGGLCAEPFCSVLGGLGQCPAGQACQRNDLGSVEGMCMPAGMTQLGGGCVTDPACASLFCHEGVCSEPCAVDGTGCAPTEMCAPITGELGVCLPKPVEPTPDTSSPPPNPDTSSPSDDTGGTTRTPPPQIAAQGTEQGGCSAAGRNGTAWPLALAVLLGLWIRRRYAEPTQNVC